MGGKYGFQVCVVPDGEQCQSGPGSAQDVLVEQARWKPRGEDRSILEVVTHLWDEEIEDFRAHVDLILHRADQPWPSIDPQGWVVERRCNERDAAESLEGYLQAREESLARLKGLSAPDWRAVYEVAFGQIAAGDMLAAWVAHDLLHTRQIAEVQWAYTA